MPPVSVIIPCYNEEKTISGLLSALLRQTIPLDQIEVVIADGMSTDHTRERIEEWRTAHPELKVRVVDNPKRIIPAGLNAAIDAASGETIIRLDAHSEPSTNYIEQSLIDLNAGMGDNVGGVWKIAPGADGWMAKSIAAAASHRFGVGDALYRYATQPALVDTVPFGAMRRSLLDRIGKYDDTLLTNEDYELNVRIRQAGGRIWLDPKIQSRYYARPDLNSLARQYWRYGFWKMKMLQRYPSTIRWRQALPPLFVLSIIFLAIFSIFMPLARLLFLFEVLTYLSVLIVGSLAAVKANRDARLLFGIPLAIVVMHFCWGCGFLWSIFIPSMKKVQ